ncbi:MAG: rhodanese-like domain-containing protein [Salinibacterium sp.]|nr:rhodanese-like domain-containing protein [Salinibacterium sp.]
MIRSAARRFWGFFGKSYNDVRPDAARSILAAGGVLVDVRTRAEWNNGHAPEAIHIPLEAVGRRDSGLTQGTPIVAVCQSGHRSAVAARMLAARGHTVSSLTGGMPAWIAAGNPVVRSQGKDNAS